MKNLSISSICITCMVMLVGCQSKSKYPSFSEVEKLHGHVCPGSAIGYRMACSAMDRTEKMGIDSGELMVIVENNRCGTDSLQCVTGCTFGKGKIIFDDYGKNVYTLFSSQTGKGIRVAFTGENIPDNAKKDRTDFTKWILEAPEKSILTFSEVKVTRQIPPRPRGSVKCKVCGEEVNTTRICKSEAGKTCIPCSKSGK